MRIRPRHLRWPAVGKLVCFLLRQAWYQFIDPTGMEGLLGQCGKSEPKMGQLASPPIASTTPTAYEIQSSTLLLHRHSNDKEKQIRIE